MINLVNISKTYNKGKENEFEALKNINLDIQQGEMLAIIGKSGAGKSTLLHIIACIERYESGQYILNGKELNKLKDSELSTIRNKSVGIVMQDFCLIEEYSAIENVMTPLFFAKVRGNLKRRTLARMALDNVGIAELENKRVNALSGGQKQRVAIARAIVNNSPIILADEPTGALDSKTSDEILDLLKKLNMNGKTVIIVTHDKHIADNCAKVIELFDGEIHSSQANL